MLARAPHRFLSSFCAALWLQTPVGLLLLSAGPAGVCFETSVPVTGAAFSVQLCPAVPPRAWKVVSERSFGFSQGHGIISQSPDSRCQS